MRMNLNEVVNPTQPEISNANNFKLQLSRIEMDWKLVSNQFRLHAEKRSVKFTGSSVLIWTTYLFSKFYKKLSSINRFSVQFT